MTALRWSWFVECIEWVSFRVGPGQTVRTFLKLIAEFDTWYWCLMRGKVAILLSKCITMAMAALRWSWSVECYGTVSCHTWTNRMYVCVYPWIGRCYWWSMQYNVSLRAVQIHYNGDDGSACVDFSWLNVWNGYRVGPARTARTFALLRACFNLKAMLLLNAVWGRNPTHTCCSNTLKWLWWRLCVDLPSLNVWTGYRVGRAQIARTFGNSSMRARIWMFYWCLMQHAWCCNLTHPLLSEYTAYCRVGPGWTNIQPVRLHCLLHICLNFTRVMGVDCSMYEVVISSSSCAVQKIHYNRGDTSTFVFFG